MLYNSDLLYTVAKLYYIEDLKQENIARKMKMSKYAVSRVLKRARNKGLVKIQVVKPEQNIDNIT